MILGVVYYIMPMTIFQQAKDMKLDPALMFVSVTAIVTIFYALEKYFEEKETEKNIFTNSFFLVFLAGILVGFAFSIKFTTIMLIIASLALLSYSLLSFSGFIGFIGIFIAIFTA